MVQTLTGKFLQKIQNGRLLGLEIISFQKGGRGQEESILRAFPACGFSSSKVSSWGVSGGPRTCLETD